MKEWWEEPFQKGWFPLPSFVKEWEGRTRKEVRSVRQLLKLSKKSKLLDVACGVGRHSLPLSRHCQVTGIDFSPVYLTIAKRNARKQRGRVRFLRCDLRNLPFADEFDAAINLWSSFGYFLRASDDKKTIRSIANALKTHGQLIMDMPNPRSVKTNCEGIGWMRLKDGHVIIEERKSGPPIFKTHWTFLTPKGKSRTMISEIRAYSRHSLTALLKRNGFSSVTFRGHLDGRLFNPNTSSRLVVIATK